MAEAQQTDGAVQATESERTAEPTIVVSERTKRLRAQGEAAVLASRALEMSTTDGDVEEEPPVAMKAMKATKATKATKKRTKTKR